MDSRSQLHVRMVSICPFPPLSRTLPPTIGHGLVAVQSTNHLEWLNGISLDFICNRWADPSSLPLPSLHSCKGTSSYLVILCRYGSYLVILCGTEVIWYYFAGTEMVILYCHRSYLVILVLGRYLSGHTLHAKKLSGHTLLV